MVQRDALNTIVQPFLFYTGLGTTIMMTIYFTIVGEQTYIYLSNLLHDDGYCDENQPFLVSSPMCMETKNVFSFSSTFSHEVSFDND